MSLMTAEEIREAIGAGLLSISPLEEKNIQGASYDARLGSRALITKALSLGELKGDVAKGAIPEVDVGKERSIMIPGGSFALVTTMEAFKTTGRHTGHIGMKTYYVRKGLILLSGLQIDPWWEGTLVLGLANLSPRSVTLEYGDDLCSIEFHRLSREVERARPSPYQEEQQEGRIPRADRDYLRTVETMSVSDLTGALLTLSNNVERLGSFVKYFWVGFAAVILVTLALGVLGMVVRSS